MTGCAMRDAMRDHVNRHFAGSIAPAAERAMREHLPGCDACRALYHRHLVLAELDPDRALPADERIARGLGLRHARRSSTVVAFAVATAAAAAIALISMRASPRADGFTARGHVDLSANMSSRVFVYDVRQGEAPGPAGDSLKAGDELAFAYVNGAAKGWLAIFGVDESGRVYWFYPAWTDDSSNPVAVPIAKDSERHELPEAIRQRFSGTHVQIRSLFLDAPLSVREIEALVQTQRGGPLSIPGAVEDSRSLVTTP
jgi:hypothetical protein